MTIPLPPAGAASGTGADHEPGVSITRAAFRQLRRQPTALVGLAIIAGFLLVAVAAPLLTPYSPGTGQWSGQVTPSSVPGPSSEHWLGLDRFGSDLWTQLVYGARQSLVYGVVATAIGVTAGGFLGILAGGLGGWVDTVIMRIVDILLSVPSLLLAVSIAAVLGQNAYAIMIAIGAAQVPIIARLLRSSMLSQARSDYVLAAEAIGIRRRRIVLGHIFPNALGPTLAQATLNLATAIIEVAALSFLGLGSSDPAVAEWGRMLVAAQDRFQVAPQLALLPGLAIAVTALGFTLLGESLRGALDPRSRR